MNVKKFQQSSATVSTGALHLFLGLLVNKPASTLKTEEQALQLVMIGDSFYFGRFLDQPQSSDQLDDIERNLLSLSKKQQLVPLEMRSHLFALLDSAEEQL